VGYFAKKHTCSRLNFAPVEIRSPGAQIFPTASIVFAVGSRPFWVLSWWIVRSLVAGIARSGAFCVCVWCSDRVDAFPIAWTRFQSHRFSGGLRVLFFVRNARKVSVVLYNQMPIWEHTNPDFVRFLPIFTRFVPQSVAAHFACSTPAYTVEYNRGQ
jgi:hypothetical protein